jgi:KUP system potassium uptake protein
MLAAGLLIGEGIITPAISVLSAVEGLAVYNSKFNSEIIPITLSILTILFLFQSKGTNSLGKIFGIVAILWFTTIALFGIKSILLAPSILKAFNPYWGIIFISKCSIHQAFIILGSTMLVITGGEALFADMGHFGKLPIRLGWFAFVYPALMLSYLGQGAFLLSGSKVINNNIFFSMVPSQYLFPTVILATLATIIASQALISGAFSLASQAVGLGLFPRIKVLHTHHEHEGQIYVGLINWFLYLGTITLVLTFKNSTSLAAAYGLSVSGVMLSTSLAIMATAYLIWKWPLKKIILIFLPIALIELSFLISNSVKFLEGGFIPVLLGMAIFIIMRTWRWGRKATYQSYIKSESLTIQEMISLKNNQSHFIDKNVVLLVPKPLRSNHDKAPALVQFFYNRYGVFPKNLFMVEVVHRKTPYIHGPRHESYVFYKDHNKGIVASTTIHFGFMEEPNVEIILEDLAKAHEIELPADPNKWLIHASLEKLIPPKKQNLFQNSRFKMFSFLRQVTQPAHFYYGLGHDVNLSVEIMPIKLTN